MPMYIQYEIIIIYDKEYGEVIGFESSGIMNDSNDIITEAIKLELIEEKYRDKVRLARIYTDVSELKKDTERERVISKMTPEQKAFCERMKFEFENKTLV